MVMSSLPDDHDIGSTFLSSYSDSGAARGAFQALRRFAQVREPALHTLEHCDLCQVAIPANHRHLLELSKRELICACQQCALLFDNAGAGKGKYRLIPQRYQQLVNFSLTDEQWESLMIPVNMAYIFRSTGQKSVMAFYPSPAGAVESLLSLGEWESICEHNPVLCDMEYDCEALLIRRLSQDNNYYIVPIDACYQLVGLIRTSWRGLSGGTEVWQAIGEFFEQIQSRCQAGGGSYA